jgi:hypothetical protein
MTINNIRIVNMPCIECGCILRFRIRDDVVVEGDGRIVANVPGAVCPDCMESLLDRVADPPGLVCIEGLSSIMAEDLLQSLEFLLPRQEAVEFFKRLFPEAKKPN